MKVLIKGIEIDGFEDAMNSTLGDDFRFAVIRYYDEFNKESDIFSEDGFLKLCWLVDNKFTVIDEDSKDALNLYKCILQII